MRTLSADFVHLTDTQPATGPALMSLREMPRTKVRALQLREGERVYGGVAVTIKFVYICLLLGLPVADPWSGMPCRLTTISVLKNKFVQARIFPIHNRN